MAALTPFSLAKMYFISKRIWCKKELKNIYNLLANYSMRQILINQLQLSLSATSKDFTYTRALFNLFRKVTNYRNLRNQCELNSIAKGKITLKIVNKLFYCIKILKSHSIHSTQVILHKIQLSYERTLNPRKIISPRIFIVQIYVWSLFKAQEVYFSENERFMVHR